MKRMLFVGCFAIIASMTGSDAAVISGIVSDSAGAPLKNIFIALKPVSGAGLAVAKDTTDSTGAYSVTCDSTSGKYVLRSRYLSFADYNQYDSVTLDGTDKTIAIKMPAIKSSSLSGTVTDSATGLPIAGAFVLSGIMKRDTTDTTGKYAIDTVKTGATVTVSATGYVAKTIALSVGDSALTVNVALVKTKYSSVSGTVADSATGTPIAGARVSFGMTKYDSTGTDGKYSLDSMATGASTLSVSARGYTGKTVSVTIGDSATTADIKLVAVRYGSVTGSITDSATGAAIAGATVTVMLKTSFTTRLDTAGTDGVFTIDSMELGSYTITASAARHTSTIDSVVVSDTALKTVNLKLASLIYFGVSGKVVDSTTGTAIAGAVVLLRGTATATASATLDSVVTDSSGQYSVDSAFTGTRLKVYIAGYDTIRLQLTGTTSTAQTIEVKLIQNKSAIKTVRGVQTKKTISIVNGRLVLNNFSDAGTVRLFALNGELVHVQSFAAGASVCMNLGERLPAGSYIVKIRLKNGAITQRFMLQ